MTPNSISSHMHGFPPVLPIPTKEKEQREEDEDQQPLLLNDGLEILIQETEKKIFNNIITQLVPAIITVLLLKLPRSRYLLPLDRNAQKPPSFPDQQ